MAKSAQFESDAFVGKKPDMTPSTAHLLMDEDTRTSSFSLNKRSMVLDEDRFEDRFLRCNVCKARFSNVSLPRMLTCHHSFCQPCIDRLYSAAKAQRSTNPTPLRCLPLSIPVSAVIISCPVCKGAFIATDENVKKLPTDHRIVQLMDFVRHTDRYTVTFCSVHRLPLNFFCDQCIQPICRNCTANSHKEADGHLVIDLEDAMVKYSPVLDNLVTEMEAESICLEEKLICLESVVKNVELVKVDLLGQVRSCVSKMRDLLNAREKALVAKVHQQTGMERNKLQEKSKQLTDRRQMLVEKTNKLREAKDKSMIEEMFKIHQEVRECRSEPRLRVREVDDGIMTTFYLNTQDEATLASRINNFCDVVSKVQTTSAKVKPQRNNFLYRSSSFR
ncbi:unnamed protein product [Candidula unifasciata]|uniref:Uncharacterized protein n=1 Tax=Candidula unifasciata TaxID=100452 RepID=A0A8S3ZZU9_9EUPU|nr:unnamed protein product [Candidula unifasciata]